MRPRITAGAILSLLPGLALVTVLYRAGFIGRPVAGLLVALFGAAIALVNMTVTARVVSDAVGRVAAGFGMSPLKTDEKGTPRPSPADSRADVGFGVAHAKRSVDGLVAMRVAPQVLRATSVVSPEGPHVSRSL